MAEKWKKKKWADMTPEEQETAKASRKEKLTAAEQKLETGLQSFVVDGRWQDYLKFVTKFHRYSWNNTLMILLQRPTATLVASFKTWRSLGRHVLAGEHGIEIFVPVIVKAKPDPTRRTSKKPPASGIERMDARDPAPLEGAVEQCVAFKIGYVFDISQTDGEPLPFASCSILQGDDEGTYAALNAFAASELGFSIDEVSALPQGANGTCNFDRCTGRPVSIEVVVSLPPLQKAKTGAHEIAHALLHTEEEYRGHDLRSLKELEAESVAFAVMHHLGLDTSAFSFPYLANWGNSGAEALEEIKKSGDRIRRAVHQIVAWIEEKYSEQASAIPVEIEVQVSEEPAEVVA